mgnify:CR=1 FL=1|tara:strand:- start:5283 stop:6011 length:729 start_codon:yes stop_codon:yes gene_type:complete
MPLAGLSTEDLELLRKYDSPTVCNAIELFEVRPRDAGYTDARIQACFPEMPPMVGYASTVTMRASAPAIGDVYSTMDKQVEAFQACLGPPVVVFQDLDSPSVAATFGEVMCSVYQTFGSVGLVTSGTGRDLEQVRELGFPAFTNGTIASHGYNHMVDLGRTVHIGGIAIFPNDLIHGDCNGIAVIPNDIAADVAHICEEFVAAEQVILDYLKTTDPTPTGLAEARVESTRQIKLLGDRVRKK